MIKYENVVYTILPLISDTENSRMGHPAKMAWVKLYTSTKLPVIFHSMSGDCSPPTSIYNCTDCTESSAIHIGVALLYFIILVVLKKLFKLLRHTTGLCYPGHRSITIDYSSDDPYGCPHLCKTNHLP